MRKKIFLVILSLLFFCCAVLGATNELAVALRQKQPVVAKLGADWCPPCRAMKAELKKLAVELRGKVIVLDLDIEKNREVARQFRINLIPTTIVFDKKGIGRRMLTGYQSAEQLKRELKSLKLI